MLVVMLLTFLSFFTSVHCSKDFSTSTALHSAVPALIVLLVLIILVSPFAYFTVHCLRLETDRTDQKLRHSKAAVESLTRTSILRAAQVASLQNRTQQLFDRCIELEPQAKAAESLAADNKVLETKLILSLATIDELKCDITTMAAQQARIADDARNFKNMFDEANQQKLIFERRAQVAVDEAKATAREVEDALDRAYELECRLEEKDAELYDARRWVKRVNSLERWVEDLEEENRAHRYLVCEYQTTVVEKDRIIKELEGNEEHTIKLEEAATSSIHNRSIIKLDESSTRNNTISAIPSLVDTKSDRHVETSAHSTPGYTYCLPIHVFFPSSDTINQAFIKASPSYNSDTKSSAPPSSMVLPPSPVPSDTHDTNYSDCDSDSDTTAINWPTPFLVSDTDKSGSDINNSCDLSPEHVFTTPPYRRSSAYTTAEHVLLKGQTSIRNKSIRADLAYWKTIWAMKFAGIRGEAMCQD